MLTNLYNNENWDARWELKALDKLRGLDQLGRASALKKIYTLAKGIMLPEKNCNVL